jgi:hypothetical protein
MKPLVETILNHKADLEQVYIDGTFLLDTILIQSFPNLFRQSNLWELSGLSVLVQDTAAL